MENSKTFYFCRGFRRSFWKIVAWKMTGKYWWKCSTIRAFCQGICRYMGIFRVVGNYYIFVKGLEEVFAHFYFLGFLERGLMEMSRV